MKRAYVLVAGRTVADFLKKALAPETQRGVEIVDGGGSYNMPSLARSLLVMRRIPVAILMNADSLNPSVIRERTRDIEELIKMVAGPVPVKVVVAVPELEACFFATPEVIEKVMGAKVPDDWIPFGLRDPKGVLDQLAKTAKNPWNTDRAIAVLDSHDIERIRATAPIQELTAFLQSLPTAEPAGVAQ